MNGLIKFIHEYSPDLILVLTAIAIFIFAPALLAPWFETEDSQGNLDLSLKVIAAGLAVGGSIASYRRFFKGRIFSPRLNVSLSSMAVRRMSDSTILHTADFEAENIGSITIWNPELALYVLHLDSEEPCAVAPPQTEGIRKPLRKTTISGIEPGETVVYHHRFYVPESIEAFRISADFICDNKHAWHRSVTASNDLN